jgi:copper chaperone CopZ
MDLNSTIDIIIKDLNEVREIIDDLKSYPGVPELQIELAKSKCKSASEVIALFKNLQAKIASPAMEKPPVMEETISDVIHEKPAKAIVPPEKEVKEVVTKVISEQITVSKEDTVRTEKKTSESIIADQFSNRSESFNEKLGGHKHEDDVLEILKTKPLLSLDEAIGINDKFLFIREIFDGNTDAYNQAIQKLESVGSLSDAMAVIMSYSGENTGDEAVRQLIDLIKRKFLAHE